MWIPNTIQKEYNQCSKHHMLVTSPVRVWLPVLYNAAWTLWSNDVPSRMLLIRNQSHGFLYFLPLVPVVSELLFFWHMLSLLSNDVFTKSRYLPVSDCKLYRSLSQQKVYFPVWGLYVSVHFRAKLFVAKEDLKKITKW